MGAAAAQIGGEALAHLLFARLRNAVEQFRCAHDHAVDAIAALGRLLLDEGALQRMRVVEGAEAFDRGDVDLAIEPIGVTQERTARPPMRTVQAPHWASPQPNFAPLSPRSLRRT